MPKVGGIGLPAREFKALVLEVTQEAVEARQAAYETVMEVLSERVTGDEALAMLRDLNMEELAMLATKDPNALADAMRELRERKP